MTNDQADVLCVLPDIHVISAVRATTNTDRFDQTALNRCLVKSSSCPNMTLVKPIVCFKE